MSMEEEKARQEKESKAKEGAAKEALDGIPEESSETQPLLDQNGEASGSGSGAKEEKGGNDEDKMDTS